MSLIQQAQLLYAEATAIPYDITRINKARVCLYRIGNEFKHPIREMVQQIKSNKAEVERAAQELKAQSENMQAVAVMGTISTQLGWIMGHVHTPPEQFNIVGFAEDIFGFLNTLAVLERLSQIKG